MTIISFHPEWLETELKVEKSWSETRRSGSLATAKREAWILFERRMLAEIRLSDSEKSDEFRCSRGRVITVVQLAHWLALRNKEMVRHGGSPSNGVRVEVTAWTDQP